MLLVTIADILAIFVYGMIAAMLGTILPDLSGRLKLTPAQNGTIALAQAMGLIAASVSVGPLIDNLGMKFGMVLGLALITIALFYLPNARSYATVALALFILGVGGGIIVVAANTLPSVIKHEGQSGTLLNNINLFFGLGGFATPFLAANLLKRNSIRLCYTVAIFTFLTLVVNAAVTIPPAPGLSWTGVNELVARPTLWLLAVLLFLYVASEVGVWNWLVRHLVAQGVPENKALNVLSLGFAIGLLVGRVAAAQILQLLTPRASTPIAAMIELLLGSAILMAIFTFAMLQTRSAAVAWVLLFCVGLAMAPVFPTALAIANDIFPKAVTGSAVGILTTCGWIGLAVSSRIIGSIAGTDPKRLKKALLLLPAMALVMIAINIGLYGSAK
jgi:fucose permease